ncbi:unnamed protein product [Closterium sp. Naga37s-1]|nr:unnamed protein product [Closterium sp. Naga37s-1]
MSTLFTLGGERKEARKDIQDRPVPSTQRRCGAAQPQSSRQGNVGRRTQQQATPVEAQAASNATMVAAAGATRDEQASRNAVHAAAQGKRDAREGVERKGGREREKGGMERGKGRKREEMERRDVETRAGGERGKGGKAEEEKNGRREERHGRRGTRGADKGAKREAEKGVEK